MKRLRRDYGPAAIGALDQDHHNWGIVGYRFGPYFRFFNTIGFTEVLHNPDSWEGWHWGAPHVYGYWWQLGVPEQFDLLEDVMRHADNIVYWSIDPDFVRAAYNGMESAIWFEWMQEAGKQQIFIDPFCNYTRLEDRGQVDRRRGRAPTLPWLWRSPMSGSAEGTYDKEYVAEKDRRLRRVRRLRDRARGRRAQDAGAGRRRSPACPRGRSRLWPTNGLPRRRRSWAAAWAGRAGPPTGTNTRG